MRTLPDLRWPAWLLAIAASLALWPLAGVAHESAPAASAVPCAPVVLVYHRFAATANDSMTVRIDTFDAQLAWLRDHGYRIVPLRDIVAWLDGAGAPLPEKAVAITVDDGHRSVYDVLRPIVLRERFPVTLFVYPSAISNASYAMTWPELRELRDSGLFDVQSHTWWHPNFDVERRRRSPDAFRRFALDQFVHARAQIEREVGGNVDLLAWPFGIYDDELAALARQAGYTAAFTLVARHVARGTSALAIPRYLMVDAYTPARLGRLLGDGSSAACAERQP